MAYQFLDQTINNVRAINVEVDDFATWCNVALTFECQTQYTKEIGRFSVCLRFDNKEQAYRYAAAIEAANLPIGTVLEVTELTDNEPAF